MSISVSTAVFAALLWLCAPASCAPTGGHSLHDACTDVRFSSMELNDRAKNFSAPTENVTEESNFLMTLPWMEADDMCDPAALRLSPGKCMGKILGLLRSYMSIVDRLAGIPKCFEFVSAVQQPMEKLQMDLSCCVKSSGAQNHVKEFNMTEMMTQPICRWQKDLLCNYTKERLFSFSILTARVFAVGDPAQHSQDSAPKCQ